MSEKFLTELAELKGEVLHMGNFAVDMLDQSLQALVNQDRALAEDVKKHKKTLAEMNDALEERIFTIIALYQPVARDMRSLVCALSIVSASERVGRYGKDIANVLLKSEEKVTMGTISNILSIPPMASNVISMIKDSLKAYETEDLSLIKDHSRRDDIVDAQRHTVFRESLTYMMEDPRTISRCSHHIMVIRYLERCADHACKIAEKVHYMVTGERVEIK
jgi:phosphate transport system protein